MGAATNQNKNLEAHKIEEKGQAGELLFTFAMSKVRDRAVKESQNCDE